MTAVSVRGYDDGRPRSRIWPARPPHDVGGALCAAVVFAAGLAAITLCGAGFGAWTATMIGVDVPNTRLKRFEQAIEKGRLLMMVDVAKDRVEEIEGAIKLRHTEAEIQGTDPTIPAFP